MGYDNSMRPLRAAARTMLAAVFVTEGLNAVRNPEQLAERAKPVTDRLAPALTTVHPRLPTDATTLVRLNGFTQVTAGLLLATGRATTPAALALAGSLVPTTLAGHRYWDGDDPAERRMQRVQFLKNVGLFGGLIFAALDRAGRPGLVWQTGHLTRHAAREAKHAAREARHVRQRAISEARHAIREARQKARHLTGS
jgi:putative oxidoreductase